MTDPSSARPTVSVVIPTYNAADLLPDAVKSVLAQTYRDFELIVVDDGSTDATPEVMEAYMDDVRYIQKENGGTASARNRGIREARGEYVAFLDADDVWRPTKLETQMGEHEADPTLAWSYTEVYLVDTESGDILFRKNRGRDQREGDVLRILIREGFITPSATVVRRDVFDEVGMFDESILVTEDKDLWLRIAARYPIRFINEPLVEMRRHPHRKTTTMNLEDALRSRLDIVDRAVQRNPQRLGDLHAVARAGVYVRIGRKWMNRENRAQARKIFKAAIEHAPTHWRAWLYGIATFLPRATLRTLGHLRAAYRKVASAF
jgi:glycosyltransferase involved in cell wall biosynthesis